MAHGLVVILGVVTCVVARDTVLFVPAIIATVVTFWGAGILSNYRWDASSAPVHAGASFTFGTLAVLGLFVATLIIRVVAG